MFSTIWSNVLRRISGFLRMSAPPAAPRRIVFLLRRGYSEPLIPMDTPEDPDTSQ